MAVGLSILPAQGAVSVEAGRDGQRGFGGDNGPPTTALLDAPHGVDSSSTATYISDTGNNRIRVITTSGSGVTISISPPGVSQTTGVQTITTVAGTGVSGSGGDGGHPLQAQFFGPTGIDVCSYAIYDAVYVADTFNNKIRRIFIPKIPTGVTVSTSPAAVITTVNPVITTVAGTGAAGYLGDGGAPTQARLNSPYDVACSNVSDDGTGLSGQNILVADTMNHVIRAFRVDANGNPTNNVEGTMRTVAGTGIAGYSGDGGEPTKAQLNQPRGVQSCSGLTIADTANHRIRRVTDASRGVVITTNPPGVVENAGSTIATIAGTGVAGFRSGDDGGNPLNAQLNQPWDLRCDQGAAEGRFALAFSDAGNLRVRRIFASRALTVSTGGIFFSNINPVITTIAGAPGDPAMFPRGVNTHTQPILVADPLGHVIRRVT